MSHENSGTCLSCAALFNRYAYFHKPLRNWFEALQEKNPEAHISCAGRGEIDQNSLFMRGASRAPWGKSSHNYNAALDLFELREGLYHLDPAWFLKVIEPVLTEELCWYGRFDAPYPELPHIEVRRWNEMAKNGILVLVDS